MMSSVVAGSVLHSSDGLDSAGIDCRQSLVFCCDVLTHTVEPDHNRVACESRKLEY